ncbi:MAG: BrnA antitoxin family protein [Betaproteobacteria bacterium]|nr:BrnA antitoxin family protein [Betaproteobacteria bacterium]
MQTIKTKSGRLVRLPSQEEEAAIQAGIDADPDNPEWTEEDFRRARPAREVLPPDLYAALIAMNRKAGVRGPGQKPTKVQTAIRFDPDVLAALKSTGRGWQTRVNDVMKAWVAEHAPG